VSSGRQSRRGRVKLGRVTAVEDDFGAMFGKALRECNPMPCDEPVMSALLPVSSNSSNAM
jgi:hypothetical protein